MRAVDILRKKRDGLALDRAEIEAFVQGVTHGAWHDYQASALLMAIYLRGMNAEETAHLTRSMVESGQKLDWSELPGPKVDKHSTGGVGDKTSLILAPLAASCGAIVPMMSGRGLGHTGGTLDKLEAIPGFRTHLTLHEFRQVMHKVGCALVGQTREIAPADKKLYALRDVTATVENIALITGSIMSKKIAEGIDGLVMDVKCGHGAFMKTRPDARCALAEALVATGYANGVRTEALITAMDFPLGRTVGNALEVREAIQVLRGEVRGGLTELSLTLAARMLVVGGLSSDEKDADAKIGAALSSGRGLEKFRQIIAEQWGDPAVVDDVKRLPTAPKQMLLRAEQPGYVAGIAAETLGRACMLLGAGRDHVDDVIDPTVGCVLLVEAGQQVKVGDPLAEVHYGDETRLGRALHVFGLVWTIADAAPASGPLILERLT